VNAGSWLLWGFVATVILTTVMSASQGANLTRMNLPYILGAAFTRRSTPAKISGFFVHMINGWLFALIYIAAFHAWGAVSWWRGAAIGFVHATFVLAVGMPMLPYVHPRVAREDQGPDAEPRLEPPGFLALHYGVQTPVSVLLAHIVYGGVLGAFYNGA
jgi:uncharacterized membrane protein YagU involved in acid resistance